LIIFKIVGFALANTCQGIEKKQKGKD
jgi:hypothetical protein